MTILKAFKTEIDPNNAQRTHLLKHAGAARYAYNWGLNIKMQAMKDGRQIPGAIELHRDLNKLKKNELSWMYQSSKCAPQEALRNLDRAFDAFFRRCKEKKAGRLIGKVGFPKFKSKKNGVGSFRLTGTIKVERDRIFLPNLKWVRLKESGYIPRDAKILSVTVSERCGRWFVSVQVEQNVAEPVAKRASAVGIDLGIKTLATCSDGMVYENPKALRSRIRKLKRLSRSASKKKLGSQNRKKASRRLAKLHYKISNIRRDVLHKMTTTLTKTNSTCVIEDLNVSGMSKNRSLARCISDAGFGEFRRQLEYKGRLYGCKIVVADRFFPSSRLCGSCGAINDELKLSDRIWICSCGASHDRDMNAAKNLKKLAVSSTDRINDCGEEGSGRAPQRDETGLYETVIQQKSLIAIS